MLLGSGCRYLYGDQREERTMMIDTLKDLEDVKAFFRFSQGVVVMDHYEEPWIIRSWINPDGQKEIICSTVRVGVGTPPNVWANDMMREDQPPNTLPIYPLNILRVL